MPQITSRAKNLPSSAIRKFMPLAVKLKDKGVHIFHLNIGQPDIKTPEIYFSLIKSFSKPIVEYEYSDGNHTLKKTLSKYYHSHNIPIEHDELIITTGGSEALIMAMFAITAPGDEIIVPEPFYTNYHTFAIQNEVTLVPFPTRLEENFALTDINKLESLITKNTKAFLINSPSNPTGAILSKEELEHVCDLAKKHNVFVISDEVYREFTYDGKKSTSVLQISGMENHAIIIDSVSKRYSSCGARIGWIASKNKDIISTSLKLAQARLSVATVEQFAINGVIEHGEKYIEEAKHEYDKRRKFSFEKLTNEGIKCGYPSGALYMIADIGVPADKFVEFMLTQYSGIEKQKETVLVTPAETFYATPNMGKTQIRLAFVLEIHKLEKAINHLIEGLKEFKAIKN